MQWPTKSLSQLSKRLKNRPSRRPSNIEKLAALGFCVFGVALAGVGVFELLSTPEESALHVRTHVGGVFLIEGALILIAGMLGRSLLEIEDLRAQVNGFRRQPNS